jgi:hypothetical protein
VSTRRVTYAQLIERDRLAGERQHNNRPPDRPKLDPDRDYKAEYDKLYNEWVKAEAKLERAKLAVAGIRKHRNTLYAQMKRSELALHNMFQQNRR